ncbi:dihydroxyacetone kinase [Herbaspirillum rubrisubalbicans]|uniref:Dihydroxyacetone kinase n=1 Tax=Herbaspirillum rubrisubalbicans TaxID=80842 RepID=A0ABX9C4N8_9BURK|nr:dihydroxyacetone kinase subunit DhaL [Herbaspirillum rubrisubalbicans]RAM65245.1 dihydroxyacetone kinase [Herbaspirillum rubrisubalbicans]RAN48877.1 dihydroxyacetone kinase [Herbaspirillum rubrisubalbicans]
MSAGFDMQQAGWVVQDLVSTINQHRDYLSQIDGAIGDGDHGINMSKGFSLCGERLKQAPAPSLAAALDMLSITLMEGIGGSMGPLYGSFFMAMSTALQGHATLDRQLFLHALDEGIAAVQAIGEAKVGDKTLMDTLVPARDAFRLALDHDQPFTACLQAMQRGAEAGRDSTRTLQARIGRASRLGERSIGVLDAGACSCALILDSLAQSLQAGLRH